jgi:putative flippase GtrA
MTTPVSTPSEPRNVIGPVTSEHIWFVIVGGYNTVFGFAVFAALHLLFPGLHYLLVLLIAHVISVINAFWAYRLFVFKVRGHVLRDLLRFWTVYLGALAVNAAALPLLVSVAGLDVLVAQGLVVFVTALMSYVGHKHFSFRRPAMPGAAEPESTP